MKAKSPAGEYSLATGEDAVRRLTALHRVYSPAGRRVLQRAGLKPGMTVADLGCGVGATTWIQQVIAPVQRDPSTLFTFPYNQGSGPLHPLTDLRMGWK
jgi:hypothetical protein